MCKVMEDMRNEAAKEAARKNSIETAKSLLLLGKLTYAEIAQATKLTVGLKDPAVWYVRIHAKNR